MRNRPTDNRNAAAAFAAMRADADELLRAVTRATALFESRPPLSFGSLSDLLDEILPTEPAAEARVARALEFDPGLLSRLRVHSVDPLRVPQIPLANLAQALRMDSASFWYLITADHVRFAKGAAVSRGERSGADPEHVFKEAWERALQDDPDYQVG